MRVIGTAGHVDHGKSTLVRALSGIDPDRLQEEKRRGMTIDLGFAWIDLRLPATGQTEAVGIVDVPGHIDFIKNMLAGVGSIDAALLIIAADEGVMPQTREHLAILDLLAVPAAVVVLTKVDLVDDPEWLELVELDVAELLETTHLAAAPIVRVSATTGKGLVELRSTLARLLSVLPPRRNRARPRLPIDRIFTLSGFGTVVTGTLLDGQFRVGDAVEILPQGLRARVRGLQSHKQQVEQGEPGSRLAINLSGVDTDQLHRGAVVTRPETLQSTLLVDLQFRLLADAPKPLTHNQRVDFFCGAAEIAGIVRLLGVEQLAPGEAGWIQVRLAHPTVLVSGDRYILRQPSPSTTLGGGVVLSPHPRRRWRRFEPAVLARFQTLAKGAPDELLFQLLARHPFAPMHDLFARSELDLAVAQDELAQLLASGALGQVAVGNDLFLFTLDQWAQIQSGLVTLLDGFHQQFPLRRGMARGEVRSRLQALLPGSELSVRLFNALLDRAQQEEWVVADDTLVWRRAFQVQLTIHQQSLVDHLLAAFAAAPYAPPSEADLLRLLGDEQALLDMLIDRGELVRISSGVLFRMVDFTEMVAAVRTLAEAQGEITLAQVRDRFDTSRKYAQALLEEMDARRLTRREGDSRRLR